MGEKVRHETVLDPAAEHLGRIYAEALLAAASKSNIADKVVDQLEEVVRDLLDDHPEVSAALASPRIDSNEKTRVIERLLGDQVDPVLVRFLKVVADRGRLGFVRYIASAARDLRDDALGRTVAEVRSAVPLTDELRSAITQRLGESLQREIVLRERVDPELIGGLVIRVGDTVFDTSVAGRIATMAKKTRKAFAHKLIEQRDRFATGSPASS